MSEQKLFHKFCSNLPSSKYIFKSGKVANFVRGQYLTSIESEIAELNADIGFGHPNIHIDPKERTVDSLHADPLAKIKKLAIEEYLAAQQRAVDPSNDMGNSVQTGVIQNSRTIASVTAPAKISK